MTHRQLIATGFLSFGPNVLAEVDERKVEIKAARGRSDRDGRGGDG
jgi:hypothetical protein